MEKIILYYKFYPLSDPLSTKLWQQTLTEGLGLKGRILISKHGINGTVGGDINYLKQYIKETKQYPGFKDIVFKWSDGSKDDFPRMSVKVRPEIVAFGAPDELQVDDSGVKGGGQHIKPNELHKFLESNKDAVFFDGRNVHEAAIGRFKDAIVPDTHTSRDFIAELESGKYDDLKNKPVVTYCTGGIRCEVLTSLMKNRGFNDVYQIDGGVVEYCEEYGDDGFWEGSLRVFDNRMTINYSENTKVIGGCMHCKNPTSNYENCAWANCNDLVLICDSCKTDVDKLYHSSDCRTMATKKVAV